MEQEDAIKMIIEALKNANIPKVGYSSYGYDLFIPAMLLDRFEEKEAAKVSPVFFDAAWALCRRGIIRPGVRYLNAQAIMQGNAGAGFSITLFGRTWLSEEQCEVFVPTEPERFGQLLAQYEIFGIGFHERAQEAIRCYGAHAYLACCVMCGAAAESILLSTAIKIHGDESTVMKQYRTARGRSFVEKLIIDSASKQAKRSIESINNLLKYWRDEAAHGTASSISDFEAFTSLALLLRVAIFVNDTWTEF